ncbi:hypothetical protein L2E82_01686 [Cichorium intybus]|uniref:Uncharacterized protein n=1 Tax=Cichorium intybus TaxID=13427 RepID=A0ACB9H0N1_CICIN|nr:hypothetical protein L2E82_01686 [Cichorium intybus]
MDAGFSSPLELPQQFRQFTISEIQLATQNFDESLVIGRGGFGVVYKGTVTNGATHLVAAIKRLDSTSNQGEADWAAKISDFGLSKLGPINKPATYVNTFVKGTFGYLDPDYYATGRLTRKSDVYAFGVVLFEVLSGKHAVDSSLDEEHWGLVNWAKESMKEGRLKQIVDYNIRERILPKCLKEFAQLAYRCLHSNPKQRPTMAEVVVCLESILALQEKASYTLHSASMKIFGKKMPMFLLSSNGDKSVGSKRSLELYFETIGGENRILCKFEFETINVATENFSKNNKISRRGYHGFTMYKGRLQNGQGVSIGRRDSEFRGEIYKNEVSLLIKLEHENLLKLLGYCIEGTEVFLVYEFALYASLGRMIDDHECTLLDWNKRNTILLGVARALLYLHQRGPFRIIHFDIKPENILLDESLDPRLSDFGIARCLAINDADRIKVDILYGTLGHIAPEYMASLYLSTKADVYGFGVLILETIAGCTLLNHYSNNPRYSLSFKQYVWTNWVEGTSSNIIDPRIHAHSSSVTRVIHIGLLCVQVDPADRPTMEEVVGMLTNCSSLTLPIPKNSISPWILPSDDYDSGAVEDFISELCTR